MLTIRTLRRASRILPLTHRFTNTPTFVIFVAFAVVIDDAIHPVFSLAVHILVVNSKARSTTRAATLPLVVSGKCVSASESATALRTGMRAFASVELCMALEIMETPEASLTSWALIRFFLAMCQKMALQVVVSREVGSAIRALVALGRGRLWAVLVTGQAHLARRRAGVVVRQRSREGEGTVTWVLVWIRCNVLVMLLRWVWLLLMLLGRGLHGDLRGGAFHGRRVGSVI